MTQNGRFELQLRRLRLTSLTGNRRDIVTGVAQDIDAAATEILIELELHAREVMGMGT